MCLSVFELQCENSLVSIHLLHNAIVFGSLHPRAISAQEPYNTYIDFATSLA